MAWFVTGEYKDPDLGTYWSPENKPIDAEMTRFEAMGKQLALEIEARYLAGPDKGKMGVPEFPWFGSYKYPPLLEGWRWSIPDQPFRTQLVQHEEEIVDLVSTPFDSWAISERVIDMIESIEPGVHQYLPFELIQPDGSVHPAKRWLLNVCTRAEVVDEAKSDVVRLTPPSNFKFGNAKNDFYLVVKAEEARKRALWFEWRYHGPGYDSPMVGDALWNAIKAAGMHGWQPHYGYKRHIKEC